MRSWSAPATLFGGHVMIVQLLMCSPLWRFPLVPQARHDHQVVIRHPDRAESVDKTPAFRDAWKRGVLLSRRVERSARKLQLQAWKKPEKQPYALFIEAIGDDKTALAANILAPYQPTLNRAVTKVVPSIRVQASTRST
jgi:hypothetical protein